jgi:hypothetical protein
VAQSDGQVEIARIANGLTTTYAAPLDGPGAPCSSPGGVKGICRASWKGKSLIVEMRLVTRPDPKGPAVEMVSQERFTFSADGKTLKIQTDVSFPNSGLGGFRVIEPSTETYTRD